MNDIKYMHEWNSLEFYIYIYIGYICLCVFVYTVYFVCRGTQWIT